MRKRWSRLLPLGTALLLAFSVAAGSLAPAGTAAAAEAVNGEAAIKQVTEKAISADKLSDWQIVALSGTGTLPESAKAALVEDVKSAEGSYARVTDYARKTLALTAAGISAENVGGYNLVEGIYNNDKLTSQGLNGPVYALIALDSGSYSVPATAKWSTEKLVDEIVSKQNADGGFALSGTTSDPDMTAMALTALAAHPGIPAAKSAGERAVSWLSAKQDAEGGYGDNAESTAQAIIAVTSAGISPVDERFTKNGVTLIDRLYDFYNAEAGGFSHTVGGEVNAFSTEQGLLALAAQLRFAVADGPLYRFAAPQVWTVESTESAVAGNNGTEAPAAEAAVGTGADIVVEGPQGVLAQGKTVTEAVYALDALKALNPAGLEITSASFGDYVSAIGGFEAGMFGGYDGWSYAVIRGGEWIFPAVGMSDFVLEQGDKMVVYYGGETTQVVTSVVATPAKILKDEPFQLAVSKGSLDWTTGEVVNTPAAGVQVNVGGVAVTTDVYGLASFPAPGNGGTVAVTITGYEEGGAPSVVRHTQSLVVYPIFADAALVSPWAADAVDEAYAKGWMQGTLIGEDLDFLPGQSISRAELAALLVRLLGEAPSAATSLSFNDVPAGAWYYGYVAKAQELGLVSGVTETAFAPHQPVTRQDLAVIIARAYNLTPQGVGEALQDEAQIGAYALNAVKAVTEQGYLSAANGHFNPQAPVTREMAATVAVRLP